MPAEPRIQDYTRSGLNAQEVERMVKETEASIKWSIAKSYVLFALIPGFLVWLTIGTIDYFDGNISTFNDAISFSPLIALFTVPFAGVAFIYDEWSGNKFLGGKKVQKLRPILKKHTEIRDQIWAFERDHKTWQYFNLVNEEGYWLSKKGIFLEDAFGLLLKNKGFKVQKTKTTGDGGVDLVCSANAQTIFVQCKGHKNKLGVSAIRDAAGVLATHKPSMMIVVCPNGFTKGSYEFAKQSGVRLMSVSEILDLVEDRIL